MNNVLISLLDKSFPPAHSFVDGVLSGSVVDKCGIKSYLLVSRGVSNKKVLKYNCSICLPVLYERRGLLRFLNFFISLYYVLLLIRRTKGKTRICLFVRNDPIYLFSASCLKRLFSRLVFQSSFPHEEASNSFFKRFVAKLIYKVSNRFVDVYTAVSPLGLERLSKIFTHSKRGGYIPLLSDFVDNANSFSPSKVGPVVKFVYIGTHAPERRIDIILKAAYLAIKCNKNIKFDFYGAKESEISSLLEDENINYLAENGFLSIHPPVERLMIPNILVESDVGISLPPPTYLNKEMSPTKLTEYIGSGLAVIANKGIQLQEFFVNDSASGILVDWEVESIAEGFAFLASNSELVEGFKSSSRLYSGKLSYQNYSQVFLELVSG